jgi:hypothetical protein
VVKVDFLVSEFHFDALARAFYRRLKTTGTSAGRN